jgi:hypothetical protein
MKKYEGKHGKEREKWQDEEKMEMKYTESEWEEEMKMRKGGKKLKQEELEEEEFTGD